MSKGPSFYGTSGDRTRVRGPKRAGDERVARVEEKCGGGQVGAHMILKSEMIMQERVRVEVGPQDRGSSDAFWRTRGNVTVPPGP